jgi:hypothetical protein
MEQGWRDFAEVVALALLFLTTGLVAYSLFVRFTTLNCGFCDAATSSVSRAPGP